MTGLVLDAPGVDQLLRDGGWRVDRIADDTWRTSFRGKNGRFPVYVKLTTEQITFTVLPFLKSPTDQAPAAALYNKLLELNQALMMAKFSIDDDLDVLLSVEYPTADLDKSEFEDALDTLTYYADQHYPELKKLGA